MGFESLVETVLGDAIKAIVVDDLSAINLADSPSLILLEKDNSLAATARVLTSKLLSHLAKS
ncbi:MAG: hypothetical protein IPM78_06795 [Moraxellaceae bacterium]|nr:hypothetical protein [Moraxellaceae bacterium]